MPKPKGNPQSVVRGFMVVFVSEVIAFEASKGVPRTSERLLLNAVKKIRELSRRLLEIEIYARRIKAVFAT